MADRAARCFILYQAPEAAIITGSFWAGRVLLVVVCQSLQSFDVVRCHGRCTALRVTRYGYFDPIFWYFCGPFRKYLGCFPAKLLKIRQFLQGWILAIFRTFWLLLPITSGSSEISFGQFCVVLHLIQILIIMQWISLESCAVLGGTAHINTIKMHSHGRTAKYLGKLLLNLNLMRQLLMHSKYDW